MGTKTIRSLYVSSLNRSYLLFAFFLLFFLLSVGFPILNEPFAFSLME